MTLERSSLTGPWTLDVVQSAADFDGGVRAQLPIAATVPGSVHTDLMASGLIEDPYLDLNELDTPWIGRSSWRYETVLPLDYLTGERLDLVFEGLDTLASIDIDGVIVARTQNMFRRYRVPLSSLTTSKSVTLGVTFQSPWDPFDNASEEDRLVFDSPSSHIRKMACNFGWDWGPALVTSGIWRPVRLERWSGARISAARYDVTTTGTARGQQLGLVRAGIEIEADGAPRPLRIELTVAGMSASLQIPAGSTTATLETEVPLKDADVWWPRGYGTQSLHDLVITLLDGETNEVLDVDSRRIGFRSSTVDLAPDEDGTPFVFVVNDTPIPIRGFNWIPDDCFPHRVDRASIVERLRAAVEANANMIRVWGGGLYESDDFYDVCDELGLLVWQDFAFACAPYPETPELSAEVEAEARDNIERLMSHASLVLWNGNNENWLGHDDWGWKERLAGRAWGAGYYLEVLPRVVAEVSPGATYWPGSPYSGSPEIYSNDRAHGVVHLWDGWNTEGYAVFRDDRARFVSEFGWQAPPAWRTLTDAVHDDPLTPTSNGVLHHQKAIDGNGKLSRGLAPYFDEPIEMDDWHWAMQLNQARAIRYAVEHFRSLRPLNMGVILWQLNDCWPVASWAVVDGAARRRPGWYATRDVYEPKLATIQPRENGLAVVLVNDEPTRWAGTARVRRIRMDGSEVATSTHEFEVSSGSSVTLLLSGGLAEPGDPSAELLVADVDGAARAWWYFVEDRALAYPTAALRTVVSAAGTRDGRPITDVVVSTDTFVRELTIHPDRLGGDVTVDTMLVTLLPGETATFRLHGVLDEDVAAQLAGSALRHAGDLLHVPKRSAESPTQTLELSA